MTYDDLTPDQKVAIQAFTDVYRPAMGAIARAFATVSKLEDAWLIVGPAVTSLDEGAVIQTTTGLAGAATLTRDNLVDSMADFQQAIAAFYAPKNRAAYIAAAGLQNTL